MLIYRGAGLLTLLTPIAAVLLILILFPDPAVGRGNTSLSQVLLAFGLGSAINTVLGFVLNRKPRALGSMLRITSSSCRCNGLHWRLWRHAW